MTPSPDLETLRTAHLMETARLAELLTAGDPALRIVDMRGYVHTQTDPNGVQTATYVGAPEEYAQAHIPGARFLAVGKCNRGEVFLLDF